MSDWWTYRLSDFLLFSPDTYRRLFELYNAGIWPIQIAAALLGLLALAAALRRSPREAVVLAIRQIRGRYRVACLTNNMSAGHGPAMARTQERADAIAEGMGLFEVVVESSKTGLRKPEPGFYLKACELLGIEPAAAVFLDDLGVNLKPAAALGMRTIKVGDPDVALSELGELIGMKLV